ncbi:hypothetical protein [Gilvimarinus polysaccharolyticus]|uniref:hypothetical protein n=1 Tax=Gilvimarinus polysaccharolyticus TaxID=863921 RepID=UPI0006737CA2|nr:hypothetical protein [Gilvimarinus polysaccharolyticus]
MIFRAVAECWGEIDANSTAGYVYFVASNHDDARHRLHMACTLWFNGHQYDAYNLNSEHELFRDSTDDVFEDAHLLEAGCIGQRVVFTYPGHSENTQLALFLPPKELQRLEAAFARAKAYAESYTEHTETIEG